MVLIHKGDLISFPFSKPNFYVIFLDSKYRLNVQHKPIALVLTL